ncbi:DUF5617 domain-containing protein [Rickettsiella endosymbiont of Miltochrista miniata]|uniref:DUF5617 domain-containing protein n=1 Tax=Rickettsiella endosymbiont of Miltochrista miniata TaxID=3066239 RepID=UPI00313AD9B9
MPIKLKNISVAGRADPLQEHINSFLSPATEKLKYAEERLKAACKAADLIKKNSDMPEKVSKSSDPLKTVEAKDKLTILSAAIDKAAQVNRESQQTVNEYLCKQDKLRKENQLVYGKSSGDSDLNHLGLGLIENQDKSKASFYQRKFRSTYAYSVSGDQYAFRGAAEFGVTYDNRIFIVPIPMPGDSIVNLYKLAQGTWLKAVGCIQIDDKQVEERLAGGDSYPKVLEGQVKYVSVYNAFFDAPKDNIAVSLFALQRLGIDLSDTQVVIPNDNASLISRFSDCNIHIRGEIQDAAYYLDETRFPGAKALAEKQLTFLDKIGELFCDIDDQVLLKRNKRFIEQICGEKELLKLNLIKLFNCTEELTKDAEVTKKNIKVTKTEPGLQRDIHQPSTSAQALNQNIESSKMDNVEVPIGSFNDYWQAIKTHIQFFKEKNIDLSFLVSEINMILAYSLQNGLKPEEKNQLRAWSIPETIIPGRGLDRENISSFVVFYENDPIKTCINLLRDYSKGQGLLGALKRFFSLAWNRHYVPSVNQFLRTYDQEELPDNLTIYDIVNNLRNSGAKISLLDNRGTLLDRLLFCVKLNGEENYFAPVIGDVESLNDASNQLTLENVQPRVPTQPLWMPPPAIRTTPPPFKDSLTGSTELVINKPGSYQETSKNKFFDEQVRPRSMSVTSKKNLLSNKFFIDAKKGLNPIVLLGEQGKEASTACPPSPRVSDL